MAAPKKRHFIKKKNNLFKVYAKKRQIRLNQTFNALDTENFFYSGRNIIQTASEFHVSVNVALEFRHDFKSTLFGFTVD